MGTKSKRIEIAMLIISLLACIAGWIALYPVFKNDDKTDENNKTSTGEEISIVSNSVETLSPEQEGFEVTFVNHTSSYLKFEDIVVMPPDSITEVRLQDGQYRVTLEKSNNGHKWTLDNPVSFTIDADTIIDCNKLPFLHIVNDFIFRMIGATDRKGSFICSRR